VSAASEDGCEMNQNGGIRTFSLPARLRIVDALRNSRATSELAAVAAIAQSFVARAAENKLLLRANAYRHTNSRILRSRLERQLSPWLEPPRADIWRKRQIGWKRFQSRVARKTLDKSIILKSPTPDGEKGVFYVSFEDNWLRLVEHGDVPKLLDEYFLIVASSWSPPDFPSLWAVAHIGPDPIFVQISNPSDMKLHERLPHGIRAVPIMASNWSNPEFYRPRPHGVREIDILMVAGWSRFKRHWLLFRALRKMRRDLRVVLIGQDSEGRTADDVWGEAKAFGVAGRIEIIRDADIDTVTEYQCNSKTSVVLSAREGSSVVVTESFFADAPVGMMHNAHIGSRVYINHQTGALFRHETLAVQLSELIEQHESYRPRAWATANVSCFHSTKTLNSLLCGYSRERDVPWNRDIVPMCWRPDPVYVRDADAKQFTPAYQDLRDRFGVVIAGNSVTESAGVPEGYPLASV